MIRHRGPKPRLMRHAGRVALAFITLLTACAGPPDPPSPAEDVEGINALPGAIPDTMFARLIDDLSEPGAYFDTDNLISNESSYLHVVTELERRVSGGVYIGVGPGQNFSYIAVIQPRLAFILDIRRDNMLEHLLFKSLFEAAPTRIEYLSLLVGSRPPPDAGAWRDSSVAAIVRYVDGRRAEEGLNAGAALYAARTVDSLTARHGVPLTEVDLVTIRGFHNRFIADGLDLRFTSHGRAPMWYYPTLRQLVLETDLEGQQRSFLGGMGPYAWLREMQLRNLIVPVVGNLAGGHTLRTIGDLARERGDMVSVVYASNVEFYLLRDGGFAAWAENVRSLPRDPDGLLVRSYFPGGTGLAHPNRVEGYYSTQVVEPLEAFVETSVGTGYAGWFDVVTRNIVPQARPLSRSAESP